MTLQEAREEVIKRGIELLERDESGNRLICPICRCGSDEDEKGLSSSDKVHFTCPLGCFSNADIIGIIGIKTNTNNDDNIVKMIVDQLEITLDDEEFEKEENKKIEKASYLNYVKIDDNSDDDYQLFYNECIENIDKCNYLETKNISKEIQERFNIGYCSEWISPTTSEDMKKYISASPRIIIPSTSASYAAIYVGTNKNVAPVQRVGESFLFNRESLNDGDSPIFVLENELDALSVIECGYDAIAIGGFYNIKSFFEILECDGCKRLLILCIDDTKEDAEKLIYDIQSKLAELKQDSIVFNIAKKFSSANDFLCFNKSDFEKSLSEGLKKAKEYNLAKVKKYQLANSNIKYIESFKKGIIDRFNTPVIKTGFGKLDEVLDGGLYEGLYILEGASSVGKTSLALQMADNIAAGDNTTDVLIFALEISRNELIAKSLSRLTAKLSLEKNVEISNGKTTRGITLKESYKSDKQINKEACKRNEKYASNIYMHICDDINAYDIREKIEKHIKNTSKAGRKVVAIIDYIQIMSDCDEKHRSSNQNIRQNIVELKRITRDFRMPIIGISSAISEDSIIYSSDVLLNLQLAGPKENKEDIIKAMEQNPRNMEISIFKNRNGSVGKDIEYMYYPQYNLFEENENNEHFTKEVSKNIAEDRLNQVQNNKSVLKKKTKR